MFYICFIDLYDKGSYELMEYICKTYKKEIKIVYFNFDGPLCIIIELENKVDNLVEYHKKIFESKLWHGDTFCEVSEDEYYEIISEMTGDFENKYQDPKIFIFYKNYGQEKDFVLNEKFEKLIKISLNFKLSDISKIKEWNEIFKEYCENDFEEFINYCFITYSNYENIDLKKLYLLDRTLDDLHEIIH